MNNNKQITCGKHKNKTFEYVLKNDSGYCKWV